MAKHLKSFYLCKLLGHAYNTVSLKNCAVSNCRRCGARYYSPDYPAHLGNEVEIRAGQLGLLPEAREQ